MLSTWTALVHSTADDDLGEPALNAVHHVATRFERGEIGTQDVLDDLLGLRVRTPEGHAMLLLCRVAATTVALAGTLTWNSGADSATTDSATTDSAATTNLADAGPVLLHARVTALADAAAASREQWLRHTDPDPAVVAAAERVRADVGLQ